MHATEIVSAFFYSWVDNLDKGFANPKYAYSHLDLV